MKGIREDHSKELDVSIPDNYVSVPSEPSDNYDTYQDVQTDWQNFLEGDSVLDLAKDLDGLFNISTKA